MIKGDRKREEIIRTAETLFCRQGYEKTGIQEIIDLLHTSKGSFYHHFASKEMLLEEICRRPVQDQAAIVLGRMSEQGPASFNLNVLFSGMMPLTGEKLTFLLMLLPVFNLPEGRNIRSGYCESLTAAFHPLITDQLISGTISGECYCPDAERTGRLCCLLLNDLWCRLCSMLISALEDKREPDTGDMLAETDICRNALEKIISAPFGSLELINLTELKQMIGQIRLHWN